MIKTAIFPVAGTGSRLRPATNCLPKELLPVFDTPALAFAIAEAEAAGVEHFVFVTSPEKPKIEAYVTREHAGLNATFIPQPEPLGLGHAVRMANGVVSDAPFVVILPDDLIIATPPVLTQMRRAYDEGFPHHMIAAMDVPRDEVGAYGLFDADLPAPGLYTTVDGLVEKPAPDTAPSTLAAVGRYILSPTIFDTLMTTGKGAGGEVQLTDAIARDMTRIPVAAFRFNGVRYDCGRPDGLLEAGNALQDARELMAQGAFA